MLANMSDLLALRTACRDCLTGWTDQQARSQYHPQLSPLAWHLGHVFYTETYWLREVVHGDGRATKPWRALYVPEVCGKPERCARLPQPASLLAWSHELEAANDSLWQAGNGADHPLMAGGYLRHFLAQHYAQHLETMAMVAQQRALAAPTEATSAVLRDARPPASDYAPVPAGNCGIGAASGSAAYDNECPSQTVYVEEFEIARQPVSNGQWLAFMHDGGYRRPELWSRRGQAWLATAAVEHPQHWRPTEDGGWMSPDPTESMHADAPVHGVCAHEADAYARWAGARLPHEYEWEHAARLGLLPQLGACWEWCANALFAYPGFRAYPYAGYSTPWFDGAHRVLRGASPHTRRPIRRPSFRNFYPEPHRHVFAGLRLAQATAFP